MAIVAVLLGAAIPADAEPPAASHEHLLLFSGADMWGRGGFVHGGLIWSPNGLDREGFALKSLVGAGTYRYSRGGAPVTGLQTIASILPGWRFIRGKLELGVFAGLDLQHHRLSPDDPGNRLRGTHAGLRAGADLWWEPSATTMISAAASAATTGASYWTRGAAGWRFLGVVYLGPEVTAFGDTTYHQVRVGAHATALRTGAWEWSAGAGWAADSDRRGGLYGRIGVLTRR